MNAQTFLDNFGTIADAPGGVDQLRDLVVDLAVDGRLHDDRGQASGRAALLGDVVELISGQHLKPEEYNVTGDGIPYFTGPADFTDEGPVAARWTNERRSVAIEGDVLLTVKGAGIGKLCVLDTPEAAISRQLMAVRPRQVTGGYLRIVLTSLRHRLRAAQVGIAIPGISRSDVLGCPIKLPSLPSQERIVAKVDELMQLCDDLESRQEARHRITTRLRASSLDALTNAETEGDLHTAWSRIRTNWEALTEHPDSVEDFRSTILQLAVRGTLVDQRSDEGSADALLADIAEERQQLLADGQIRKLRTLAEVRPPFEIPPSWRWVRLGSVLTDLSYGTAQKCRPAPAPGSPVLRIPNLAVDSGGIDFCDLKYTELSQSELTKLAVAAGDLLIIRSNGSARLVGRSIVVPEAAAGMAFAGYLMRARLCGVDPHYVRIALETPGVRAQIEGPIRTTSGVKNVNSTEVMSLQIPLPPLAEQRRIVERVGQLGQRCVDLEDALRQRTEASRRLASAIA